MTTRAAIMDRLGPASFIVVHCTVWWLMVLIAKPGLDSYGDMVEVFAWSQHWLAGSDKHPQLLPWLTRVWFSVMPVSVASFYLLSAINLGVGLLGIAALGRAAGLNTAQVRLALALQMLAFPYLTLAEKLNMNSILLALWPWVGHAFLRMSATNGRARLVWAGWLGVISAGAMMGKYFSAMLLLSILILSLTRPYRHLWRGLAPVVFVAALIATLLPHLLWLRKHLGAVTYAVTQGDEGINLTRVAKFALSPISYWPIPLLLALLWLYRGGAGTRLRDLMRPQGPGDALVFLTALPFLLTLAAGAVGLAELSQPWAIPLGFAFTLLMVRNRSAGPGLLDGLHRAYLWIWPAMLVLAVVYALANGITGKRWHYTPEAASSAKLDEVWRQSGDHGGRQIGWAASGNDAARLAFFLPLQRRPEALPALPDQLPSYYPSRPGWRDEAGAIICALRPTSDTPDDAETACLANALGWAATQGLNARIEIVETSKAGWRFQQDIPFTLSAVLVWP